MTIYPWYVYKFDNDIFFDLHKKKLINVVSNVYNFKKYGAIIETNNLFKFYNDFKLNNQKTLVI
ncbi:MAG: hypothetical protein EOP34_09460 [Rickettsiales bacterium]|nr:MAG: hypothetical protein EOP34_09460 [Rickettsiales bacterium]